ncbi:MAG TPA: TonB family protein [Pyrinomonadaceae bacterium]|nr:TonB family protein [Pyrinomonadaceae bacterium]
MFTFTEITFALKCRAASFARLALCCACLSGVSVVALRAQEPPPEQVPEQPPSPATAAAALNAAGETTRGISLYHRGKHGDAIKLLRAATKKRKEDAEAWLYLGLSYLKTDEIKQAREALKAARRLRPTHDLTLIGLAVAFVKSGDDNGAMEAATEAVKHGQRNAEAHYLLGAVNYRIGRFPQALEWAEAALKINPAFASAHYLKGQTLLGLSDQALTNSRNETPEVRSLLAEKADARFIEATQTLEAFMRLAPNAPEIPKLREELQQMRLFRDAVDPSNPNRSVFAAREVTARAKITSKPEPLYTVRARRNQTTGTVRLRIVLSADGTVGHIYPARTLPDGLTEASIEAARKIKFVPAMKDGRLVSQFVTIEYNFNIF